MDNIVGRIQSYFPQKQLDVIIGTMLGDGRLEQRSRGIRSHSARLRIHQGEAQKEYVLWKYGQLKEYVDTPPRRIKSWYNEKRDEPYFSWYFHTRSTDKFRVVHDYFYDKDGKKIVPATIESLLTPATIAVWAMDDGSYANPGFNLNTHSFSVNDQNLLQDILARKFGIFSALHRDRSQWKISISAKSVTRFMNLIAPFTIPSMNYKIVFPVSTEALMPRFDLISDKTSDLTARTVK